MADWFDSRRSQVLAKNGMVATSQPVAASTGLRILMEGGNAVDACVGMAAVLAVVEPVSTGLCGDLFALVWMDRERQVRALNGSGRAPAAANIDELRQQGVNRIPVHSPYAVSVPGTVDGWQKLVDAYGTMTRSELLQPAIRYAEEGFAVTAVISKLWEAAIPILMQYPSGEELLLDGRAPREGDMMRLPGMAKVLRDVADGGPDAFYRSPLAKHIAEFVQECGGWLAADDLASHTSTWDEAISTDYRGVTCWQCPPNGSGMAVLMALNIAENFDIADMGLQTPATYHHLIESMRLSYADTLRYVADPQKVRIPLDQLLSKDYSKQRASLISSEKAMLEVSSGDFNLGSDTVYITAVDGQGNACSFINSVYEGFGTGMVVPGTAMCLHNRGSLFSLDSNHLNALEPGKRPYHTIIPGMATRGGELWLSYGVMGAFQQPQGQLQVLCNLIDFGLDPQAALNALRFSIQLGRGVMTEEGLPLATLQDLGRRGHNLATLGGYQRVIFGGGQVIARDPDTGLLHGGSEPRKDGAALGW